MEHLEKKAVISPISKTGEGTERFHVMALTDIDGKRNGTSYYWYYSASKNENTEIVTSEGFETGKDNTRTMIEKWNNKAYGEQNASFAPKFLDVWGAIQEEVGKGWYVPSKEEWSAFGDRLNIDEINYKEKNLSEFYWTSSQVSEKNVWAESFMSGFMASNIISIHYSYIRLGTTF